MWIIKRHFFLLNYELKLISVQNSARQYCLYSNEEIHLTVAAAECNLSVMRNIQPLCNVPEI